VGALRLFDSDASGELRFSEFCSALADMQYKGDVPGLWRDLGGSVSNSLSLGALDPENAAILDVFARWCTAKLGGPIEVFRAIDADQTDSLRADEFAEGLRTLGFFEESILTEELVLANLYPLLDQSGHGCITPDHLIFLEKDKQKRARIERQLSRIREKGAEGAPEPLQKDAERFLHGLSVSVLLGGKNWKLASNSSTMRRSLSASFQSQSLPSSPSRTRHSMRASTRGSQLTSPHSPLSPDSLQSLQSIQSFQSFQGPQSPQSAAPPSPQGASPPSPHRGNELRLPKALPRRRSDIGQFPLTHHDDLPHRKSHRSLSNPAILSLPAIVQA